MCLKKKTILRILLNGVSEMHWHLCLVCKVVVVIDMIASRMRLIILQAVKIKTKWQIILLNISKLLLKKPYRSNKNRQDNTITILIHILKLNNKDKLMFYCLIDKIIVKNVFFCYYYFVLTDPTDNNPFLHLSISPLLNSLGMFSLCNLFLVHATTVSFSVVFILISGSGKTVSIGGKELVCRGSVVLLLISGAVNSSSL